MSGGYCMQPVRAIAETPIATWADQVKQLPESCSNPICRSPRQCIEHGRDWLRTQYQILHRAERLARQARTA